jgi:hypothetical protein
MTRTLPRSTRIRYLREAATARRAATRASNRANQAATWAMACCFMLILATAALVKSCGQADAMNRHIQTVAGLLQRQTEVLLSRLPARSEPPALDLPAAIAEGA